MNRTAFHVITEAEGNRWWWWKFALVYPRAREREREKESSGMRRKPPPLPPTLPPPPPTAVLVGDLGADGGVARRTYAQAGSLASDQSVFVLAR